MLPSDSPESRRSSAGFTLLEALVALSVVAVVLAAIGGLVAANIRGTRDLDQRLSLLQTARAILTGLPDRAELGPGTALTGDRAGHQWRVDVKPLGGNMIDPRGVSPWQPESVVIQVQSPGGQVLRLDTVRLRLAKGARQ